MRRKLRRMDVKNSADVGQIETADDRRRSQQSGSRPPAVDRCIGRISLITLEDVPMLTLIIDRWVSLRHSRQRSGNVRKSVRSAREFSGKPQHVDG